MKDLLFLSVFPQQTLHISLPIPLILDFESLTFCLFHYHITIILISYSTKCVEDLVLAKGSSGSNMFSFSWTVPKIHGTSNTLMFIYCTIHPFPKELCWFLFLFFKYNLTVTTKLMLFQECHCALRVSKTTNGVRFSASTVPGT